MVGLLTGMPMPDPPPWGRESASADDPAPASARPQRAIPFRCRGTGVATPSGLPVRVEVVRLSHIGLPVNSIVSVTPTEALSAGRHRPPGGALRFAGHRMATLTGTVPFATIVLDFDPVLHVGGTSIRWETLGLAGAILAALLLAAIIAGGTDANEPHLPMWARS